MRVLPTGVRPKRFLRELGEEAREDQLLNGAAALAYYLTLAIFPALLFLLSIVPYLPIAHIDRAILDLLGQALPAEAARLLTGTVVEIATHRKGGLLSFSLLVTLWAASSGTVAVMQQLNNSYDVEEGRSLVRSRLVAVGLTLALGALILLAFGLVVLGGEIQDWLAQGLGRNSVLLAAFAAFRWVVIVTATLLGFAVAYYFGPDVEQRFRFVSPGSVVGTLALIGGSLLFRLYVAHFGNYGATYGSIGAVVVLMLWLYLGGIALLFGSEINALYEHYHPEGKDKGEKQERAA